MTKTKPFNSVDYRFWLWVALCSLLIISVYYSSLVWLITRDWSRDEYNYGYLIPFVTIFLIWLKRDQLNSTRSHHSWLGIVPIVFALTLFFAGELSGEFFTSYISLWLLIVGLSLVHLGWIKLKIIAFPLLFLLTMFPLPNFLFTKLMLKLQLISSQIGVSIIQWYGLPVYREGNIIDLGFTQLQVVEACSGLNSLISLMVLSLLIVYFFKDHILKRIVLFVSSIPLAILTNSFRIALTGILFKHWGADVAQGFFHGFSGLMVFALCLPVLFIEMKVLEKLPPLKKAISVDSDNHSDNNGRQQTNIWLKKPYSRIGQMQRFGISHPLLYSVVIILLGVALTFSRAIEFREKVPLNRDLAQFPLQIRNWKATKQQRMEQIYIDSLDLSDYLIADYYNKSGKQVNLYIAYYESQSKGKSIHSPATCLPGSGWEFSQDGNVVIDNASDQDLPVRVNRAVMQMGHRYQISYYWFSQRGRILTNAYQLKLFNFWDSLIKQRTDGALVRLITPVYEGEKLKVSEKRLQKFVQDVVPVIEEYIPGRVI